MKFNRINRCFYPSVKQLLHILERNTIGFYILYSNWSIILSKKESLISSFKGWLHMANLDTQQQPWLFLEGFCPTFPMTMLSWDNLESIPTLTPDPALVGSISPFYIFSKIIEAVLVNDYFI